MGGLLSCHQLATLKKFKMTNTNYNGYCLKMAIKLGDTLLPAFANGMPVSHLNLKTGINANENGNTCSAAIGTLLLEFGTLSRLTNNDK